MGDRTTKTRPAGEQLLRLLIDAVVDYAIYMVDPAGIVVTWNPGAARMKGYSEAEIVGRPYSCFFTETDRAAGVPERNLEEARRTGRCESEGWRLRRDGTRFWALAILDTMRDRDGTLIGYAKITRDITERRRALDELRESERRFRLLVEGVTDYAIFMLDPDGRVASWNAGAERIKGYTRKEILGKPYSIFFGEEDRAAGVPEAKLATARAVGRSESEGWRVRRDGTRFWASAVLDAIFENGQLVGFAKVTRDMTEWRAAQHELEATREQLFQSQKLETVGQLTGGIAHDFSNLLTVIRGGLELAAAELGGNARLQRLHDRILDATERAVALTHQLLAFSRLQPLQPQVFDPVGRLAESAALLQRALGEAVTVTTDLPPGIARVEADPAQLDLAILNLGLNARDAMPKGGTLLLSARNVPPADPALAPNGGFVAIAMADTGTGIPPELVERVIEPFFTTKEVGKGSGLGLSQAYGFARQSGRRPDDREHTLPGNHGDADASGRMNATAPGAAGARHASRRHLGPGARGDAGRRRPAGHADAAGCGQSARLLGIGAGRRARRRDPGRRRIALGRLARLRCGGACAWDARAGGGGAARGVRGSRPVRAQGPAARRVCCRSGCRCWRKPASPRRR